MTPTLLLAFAGVVVAADKQVPAQTTLTIPTIQQAEALSQIVRHRTDRPTLAIRLQILDLERDPNTGRLVVRVQWFAEGGTSMTSPSRSPTPSQAVGSK